MINLDIIFSGSCPLQCPYCCINQNNIIIDNQKIEQALIDNSFYYHIKKHLTSDVKSISFWGKEPSVNGKYFGNLVRQILDYSPYIRYIVVSTNGMNNIYKDFIHPVMQYACRRRRKIKFILQFSLDGSFLINSQHRTFIASQNLLNNLVHICNNMPYDRTYFTLEIIRKNTLIAQDLYTNPLDNQSIAKFLKGIMNQYRKDSMFYRRMISKNISMEMPGQYTLQDGKQLQKWPIDINIDVPQECLAGIQSMAVDYAGNTYDCHLMLQEGRNNKTFYPFLELTIDKYLSEYQIDHKYQKPLYNAISSMCCWCLCKTEEDIYSCINLLYPTLSQMEEMNYDVHDV